MSNLGTRLLKIAINGTDYTGAVTTATVQSAAGDTDYITFADAAAGGNRAYTLNLVTAQDTSANSLWDLVWSSAGSDVAVYIAPYGNETATTDQKHYSMSAVVSEPDGDYLGGAADPSTTAVLTVSLAWDLDAKPTAVTTGTFTDALTGAA